MRPTILYFGLVIAHLIATCASAQPTPNALDDQRWHPRYDLFQLLLEENLLETQRTITSLFSQPDSSVLIIASESGRLPSGLRSEQIRNFVERGGAALLMMEMDFNMESPLPGIGTLVDGPVISFTPSDRYQSEFDDCLNITALNDSANWFPGVKKLVTNRSDYFLPEFSSRLRWHTYAAYPNTTHPLGSRSKSLVSIAQPTTVAQRSASEPNSSGSSAPAFGAPAFGAADQSGGVLIMIADSSLLTNGMLWHGDNAKFGLRLAELFRRQQRTQLMFIDQYRALPPATDRLAQRLREEQARLDALNVPRPEPSLERMLRLGNAIAKEVADSNVLNEALSQRPRNLRPEIYFRFLLGALLLAVLAWALWTLISSRPLRELWLTRRRMRYSYEIVSGNEAGDYRTAAGYLAREFCIQWTGSHHSRDWQQALGLLLMRTPSITPEDRHQLTRIVDIASRGCHEPMPTLEFQNFGRVMASLRSFTAVHA